MKTSDLLHKIVLHMNKFGDSEVFSFVKFVSPDDGPLFGKMCQFSLLTDEGNNLVIDTQFPAGRSPVVSNESVSPQ